MTRFIVGVCDTRLFAMFLTAIFLTATNFLVSPVHGFSAWTLPQQQQEQNHRCFLLECSSHSLRTNAATSRPRAKATLHSLLQAKSDNGGGEEERASLSNLGFSDQEIQRSRTTEERSKEPIKVNVSLIPDVDPVTLTAIGFSLIATNFFIFANLGDGGIAGVLATIINLLRQ